MTKKELNRDVKKLYNTYKSFSNLNNAEAFFKWREEIGDKELIRLYHADTSLQSLTADNLRKLLRLNLSMRVIALHMFGINIEL